LAYTNKIQQKVIKQWIQDAKFCILFNGLKYLDSLHSDTFKLQNTVPLAQPRSQGGEERPWEWGWSMPMTKMNKRDSAQNVTHSIIYI